MGAMCTIKLYIYNKFNKTYSLKKINVVKLSVVVIAN